jgi:hypothetical protein
LLGEFAPKAGQAFDFLKIEGLSNFDLSLVNLILESPYYDPSIFQLDFIGGTMSLITTTTPIPVPASVWLFASG